MVGEVNVSRILRLVWAMPVERCFDGSKARRGILLDGKQDHSSSGILYGWKLKNRMVVREKIREGQHSALAELPGSS